MNHIAPGLRQAARAMHRRIIELEESVITHTYAGEQQQALYAAHTATYLRSFLAELVGPTWLALVVNDWPQKTKEQS
ncbi:hypothetical protein [Streptomyces sp. S584]|uniref:hypothetical protein n=1 Tax=Streptomyces sp. S584 TaxID=3096010 RepID=UPI002AFEF1A4|nr:hypothetical protein [Streptomyces sp. S584]